MTEKKNGTGTAIVPVGRVSKNGKPVGFQPGHPHGRGNPGPSRPNFLTQTLISQLHEVDRFTENEVKHELVARLIQLGLGGRFKIPVKRPGRNGKTEMVDVILPPDINAIREIFNRVEGKALQPTDIQVAAGITIRIAPEDSDV